MGLRLLLHRLPPASRVCPFKGLGRLSIFGRTESQGPGSASLDVAEVSNLLRTGCLAVGWAVDSRRSWPYVPQT